MGATCPSRSTASRRGRTYSCFTGSTASLDVVIEVIVNGVSAGVTTIPGGDVEHRWRNGPVVIPGRLVSSSSVVIHEVPASEREVLLYRIWFFQPRAASELSADPS